MNDHRLHRSVNLKATSSDLLICALLIVTGIWATSVHAEAPGDVTNTDRALNHEGAVANQLHFVVDNIRTAQGSIMVQVLASEAAFDGSTAATASMILPAQSSTIEVRVDGFPAGEYAIRVMQDLDGDGVLKTNLLGMPKEPWGVSNNASGNFGPPKWEDARFPVPSVAPQTINLR